VLVSFSYFCWLISRDSAKVAKRVRELEKDINCRAGETLLVWETLWGREVTGYPGASHYRQTGLGRESLYKALSPGGNP